MINDNMIMEMRDSIDLIWNSLIKQNRQVGTYL